MTDKQVEWLRSKYASHYTIADKAYGKHLKRLSPKAISYWAGRREGFDIALNTLSNMPSAEELEKEEGDKCK